MGTVIAIEIDGGAAIAGDRQVEQGGTVTGEGFQRVFDYDDVGAGAVGDAGDVQSFDRQFEAALREHRMERDRTLDLTVVARLAAEVVEATGVDAVVAGHDEDGTARVRHVNPEGGVLEGPSVALGSGLQIAHGRLETADHAVDVETAADTLREVMATVAERDAETGEDVDVWTLANEGDGGR